MTYTFKIVFFYIIVAGAYRTVSYRSKFSATVKYRNVSPRFYTTRIAFQNTKMLLNRDLVYP